MRNKNLKKFIIKLFIIILFHTNLYAEKDFFNEGKELFESDKYDEAKFKFEKDIVFNPKNENSYLYLAKVYKKKKDNLQEEKNLNTVVLLNPKNEEAVYHLALLNIKRSNYKKTESLIKRFKVICKKLCSFEEELNTKLQNSLKQ